MRHTILFLAFFLFLTSTKAQTCFQKTYGGPTYEDAGYSCLQTLDKGYIFCGTHGTNANHYFYLVKTDSIGDTLWTRNFKSDRDNIAYRIRQTKDTCYIIAGYSGQWSSNYTQDVFLMKVKANGDSIWGKTYGSPGTYSEEGFDVIQTKDGGYIIAGCFANNGFGYYYVVRTDWQGTQKWTRLYNVASSSSAKSITETFDGHYAITGPVFNSSYNHVGIAKIDSAGGPSIWFKNLQVGPLEQLPTQVTQLADSTFTILSSVNIDYNNYLSDMCIVKTNKVGDTVWTKKFAKGRCQHIEKTSDGGYAVGGYSNTSSAKAMLVKLDANYDTVWTRKYSPLSGYLKSYIYDVHQTADKGYILTGKSTTFSDNDALLIKTDSMGYIISQTTFADHAYPVAKALVFPNPFSEQTRIVLPAGKNNFHVKIVDDKGMTVSERYGTGKEFIVNRQGLRPGNYTIIITDAQNDQQVFSINKIIIIE